LQLNHLKLLYRRRAQASGILSGLLGTQATAQTTQTATTQPNTNLPLAVIRAMIGAAKADGHMDTAEMQKIMDKVRQGKMPNFPGFG